MSNSTTSQQPTSIKGMAFTSRILHLALCASVVIYGVVLHIVLAQPSKVKPASLDEMMPLVLAMAALAIATALIAIPIVRKKMLPPRKAPEHRDDTLPDNLPSAAHTALGKLFTVSIITWALCESIAIYGLVLGFIIREAWIFYPFAGPALLLMALFAPKRADLEAVAGAALVED